MRMYSRFTIDVDAMAKRARRKAVTMATMGVMLDTLKHSDLRSQYNAAHDCCTMVKKINLRHKEEIPIVRHRIVSNGFMSNTVEAIEDVQTIWHDPHAEYLVGQYCKKRFCTVCNNIRSTQAYIKYGPVFPLWESPYFVTLTVQNAPQNKVYQLMDEMGNTWRRLTRTFENEKRRHAAPMPAGIRKLECTYNAVRNDYHPHYHVICDSQKSAERIVNGWLEQWPRDVCSPKAQNMKPADPQTIFELFKYFAKSISRKEGDTSIYPHAMDVMFRGMSGRRIIQDFNMGQYRTVFGADVEQEKPEGFEFGEWFYYDKRNSDWFNVNDRTDRIVGLNYGPETLIIRHP